MAKVEMRSMSETRPGKIIASKFCPFKENGIKFRVIVMLREYEYQGKLRQRTEYVILVDSKEKPMTIIMTEFGPTCGFCLTSDYIKEDKSGEWFDQKHEGYTCTRCGAGTLQ